jgi:flagellar protein FliO/FliZ
MSEPDLFLRLPAALALILGLLLLMSWLLRRHEPWLRRLRSPAGARLGVVETLWLDPRHRLVLVRCDGREQLLLLGPQGAVPVPPGAAPPELVAGRP